jgi:periplasmic protein TonB
VSTLPRLFGGIPVAVIVTIGLFLLLATVITQQQDVQLDDTVSIEINVTRQIEDTTDQRRQDMQRPVLDQPPPPPPTVSDPDFRPSTNVQMGALPDLSNVDLNIGTGFNPDRDAQPLVRIPPQYPQRCMDRARPVETVVLQFDVSPEGSVVNPEVIDSTNTCLNRAAIRAVQRWRYNPKVVDDVAQPRFGVRTAIDFTLEEAE